MTTTTERPITTSGPAGSATARPIIEVDANTLRDWLAKGDAAVLDVREADEHARERLAEATLTPLSQFDPIAVHGQLKERLKSLTPAGAPARLVLLCRSGRRATEAAARLASSGPFGGVQLCVLRGGLEGWKSAGLPVIADRTVPISIMRQVQLAIGVVVLGFSALAIAVSPWFAAVPAAMGAGLIFAGATGICGLATMLSWMPWNRAFRSGSCAAPHGR